MIKKMLHTWLIVMALASILAGCHGTQEYDSRLTRIDSLLQDTKQRKVALSQLDSIGITTFTNEGDRAYYALLLTQARYLNRVELVNDSDINVTIDYFKRHSHDENLEKLARAYIYKGAVYEDLQDPATAMHYYKLGETTAGENDDFNRGYALLRMGKLYSSHYAYDGRDIEKLGQALKCFENSKNTDYQLICLKELGALYRSRNAPAAEQNLKEAISIAKRKGDTVNMVNSHNNLAYLYFMQGQVNKAYYQKGYNELQRIKSIGLEGLESKIYTTFACVYANMDKADSAMLILNMINPEADSAFLHSTTYLEALGQIAKGRGDMNSYYKLSHESDSMSFSMMSDPHVFDIIESEVKFNEQQKYQQEKAQRNRMVVLALICSALLLAALLFYRRSHRYDKLVLELKDQSQNQMQDLTDMQQSINELQINDERLKGFISSHMGMMREIIEACYHEPNNRIAENMKRIVKFQDSNKDNWVKLYDYIDLEHNHIMTRTRDNYPELNDRELLLLALTCMGYTYIQIAIIMGYSNATSVSVIKQRLVKKMGLDCSLNEYIQNNDNQKK